MTYFCAMAPHHIPAGEIGLPVIETVEAKRIAADWMSPRQDALAAFATCAHLERGPAGPGHLPGARHPGRAPRPPRRGVRAAPAAGPPPGAVRDPWDRPRRRRVLLVLVPALPHPRAHQPQRLNHPGDRRAPRPAGPRAHRRTPPHPRRRTPMSDRAYLAVTIYSCPPDRREAVRRLLADAEIIDDNQYAWEERVLGEDEDYARDLTGHLPRHRLPDAPGPPSTSSTGAPRCACPPWAPSPRRCPPPGRSRSPASRPWTRSARPEATCPRPWPPSTPCTASPSPRPWRPWPSPPRPHPREHPRCPGPPAPGSAAVVPDLLTQLGHQQPCARTRLRRGDPPATAGPDPHRAGPSAAHGRRLASGETITPPGSCRPGRSPGPPRDCAHPPPAPPRAHERA